MPTAIDRSRLLTFIVVAATLGALAIVQGCSSSDPDYVDKPAKVSANHGHSFTLTAEQQEAGQAVTIVSRGGNHAHKLYLSTDNVATVAAGDKWAKECSRTSGHAHIVMFNY